MPSPLVLYGLWSPRYSTAAYKDPFEMFADAAEIGRSEILELVSLGCEYIQVDAPELATLVDPRVRDWASARHSAPSACSPRASTSSTAWSRAISGVRLGSISAAATTRACGWPAAAMTTSPSALFERVRRSTRSSSSTTARSGSFEPLAGAPDDKQVVLGLVSTKAHELETPADLESRIDEAARFFPREQLGLSTQCGFASVAFGNPITEADEEQKLRLVADTAHAAWG